jgi:hypothetical protein
MTILLLAALISLPFVAAMVFIFVVCGKGSWH